VLIINGQPTGSDRPSPLVFDEGLAFGRGAFETLPVYRKPMWLESHLERLNRTLSQLRIRREISPGEILDQITQAGIQNQALKIIVTAENVILVTRPLPQPVPDGIRLVVHPGGHPSRPPLASMKTLNYLGCLLAAEQAQARGFHDALFVSAGGQILETTKANIFIIQGNQVCTPPADGKILPGMMRQFVLGSSRSLAFKLEEKCLTLQDAAAADAVFVTNSLIGIQPVGELCGEAQRQLYPGSRNSRVLIALQAAWQAAGQAARSRI
jgi:branched-subunit amino acid aminotransferase/4-amino-4-deoxychorismate lyase